MKVKKNITWSARRYYAEEFSISGVQNGIFAFSVLNNIFVTICNFFGRSLSLFRLSKSEKQKRIVVNDETTQKERLSFPVLCGRTACIRGVRCFGTAHRSGKAEIGILSVGGIFLCAFVFCAVSVFRRAASFVCSGRDFLSGGFRIRSAAFPKQQRKSRFFLCL